MAAEAQRNSSLAIPLTRAKAKCGEHRSVDTENVSDTEKVSGTVILLPGPPVGTNRHLQAEAPHHLSRPQRLPERAAALDRATQGCQLGFALRGVDQLHPTPGTLQRPGRQPWCAAGLGPHPAAQAAPAPVFCPLDQVRPQ